MTARENAGRGENACTVADAASINSDDVNFMAAITNFCNCRGPESDGRFLGRKYIRMRHGTTDPDDDDAEEERNAKKSCAAAAVTILVTSS